MIEVTFDIDANGIVNVAAKDQATGKEQKITITASTNLTKEDIERLVKEATVNAAADHKVKEEADIRNEADQACYLIEQLLREGCDKVRQTNRSRAQMLIAELRQKLEKRESMDEIKRLTADLQALLAMIRQDIASPATADTSTPGGRASHSSGNSAPKGDDDIIDVEYTAA
jgi:molecular chaperone DnaK